VVRQRTLTPPTVVRFHDPELRSWIFDISTGLTWSSSRPLPGSLKTRPLARNGEAALGTEAQWSSKGLLDPWKVVRFHPVSLCWRVPMAGNRLRKSVAACSIHVSSSGRLRANSERHLRA
jgi:hypothetical protein